MERVLVVDKDQLSARSIVGAASGIGVGVDLCEGTTEALKRLKSHKYCSVIVDIDNAGTNPTDVVSAFRGASPGTSIITFTARNRLELERKIRLKGVFYYMVGPLSEIEFKEALEGAVRAADHGRFE
ncbi:response regulator [candidate division TA06 bacterium]|uniref:Response regulator n=1 Tax=candidate division TA06 bacterium TaxID=2250710 RepID=A0A523UUL2_UNCT6|nr:MAG: response regulator [candidate division TA06 bacterium]